jgi:hypothetical protein
MPRPLRARGRAWYLRNSVSRRSAAGCLFYPVRSGALAHAFEEMQSGERNKGPIPRQLIWTYTGPPPRKLAGAAP